MPQSDSERIADALERIADALDALVDGVEMDFTAQDDSGGTGNGPPPR